MKQLPCKPERFRRIRLDKLPVLAIWLFAMTALAAAQFEEVRPKPYIPPHLDPAHTAAIEGVEREFGAPPLVVKPPFDLRPKLQIEHPTAVPWENQHSLKGKTPITLNEDFSVPKQHWGKILGGDALSENDVPDKPRKLGYPNTVTQIQSFALGESVLDGLHQYRLEDTSGRLVFESGSHSQLAAKLNALLTQGGHQAVFVEIPGLSLGALDALASSLRIQQRQIDSSVSVFAVPNSTAGSGSQGLRYELAPIVIEEITSGADTGKFSATLSRSTGYGWLFRAFMQVRSASAGLILEFLSAIRPSDSLDKSLSLQEHVARARSDIKKTHPGLTPEQLRIGIIDQFGKIEVVDLLYKVPFPWS